MSYSRKQWTETTIGRDRPLIAFFDYPDVFEDFYPNYGVDKKAFRSTWRDTGSHAFVDLLQREVGDVIWYELSLEPEVAESRHQTIGHRIRFIQSSWAHRRLWKSFYLSKNSWRWRARYRAFATGASYLAPLTRRLWKALRRDDPDLILVEGYSSGKFDVLLGMAKRLGIPLVAHHVGGAPEGYLGTWMRKKTLPRADKFLASGREESESLHQRFKVGISRVEIVLTPVDTNLFRPMDKREALTAAGLDRNRRYLLFVGRLQDGVKRVSAIIRCFSNLAEQYPDVDLTIVGRGPDEDQLKQQAAHFAPSRVRWLGWVTGPEALASLYNAAECLFLPSQREGLPTVVAEAAACGTPVVASKTGGVPELVDEGATGWMVPPGDDSALLAAMGRVLVDPDGLAAMRPHIRERALVLLSAKDIGEQLRQVLPKRSIDGFDA